MRCTSRRPATTARAGRSTPSRRGGCTETESGCVGMAQRRDECAWQESNLRPRAPEARALSPELQALARQSSFASARQAWTDDRLHSIRTSAYPVAGLRSSHGNRPQLHLSSSRGVGAADAASGLEPGSFRDPDSRVFTADGRVLRLLSAQGLADWRALAGSPLFAELESEGKLVGTREADGVAEVPDALHGEVAAVLEHDVVPVVSYPYEWTFGVLRDAAPLQLELVRRAIGAGLILKDSSPYNVQFRGTRPVFVDVGSFERLREGEPWAGYRQFCMLFLYPLLLQAWKDVPFQPWLRGRIDGISPQECRNLLSLRDRFRRGSLTHVFLHARLERRYENRDVDVRGELKAAGFRKELILANVKRLERLVGGLTRRGG